jgi:serine/threonine protein kinase
VLDGVQWFHSLDVCHRDLKVCAARRDCNSSNEVQ